VQEAEGMQGSIW